MSPWATGVLAPPKTIWSGSVSRSTQPDQLRERTAGLPGGRRSLLAAESPHPHRCHGSSTEIIGAKRSAIKQNACLATTRVSLLASFCEGSFELLDCDARHCPIEIGRGGDSCRCVAPQQDSW